MITPRPTDNCFLDACIHCHRPGKHKIASDEEPLWLCGIHYRQWRRQWEQAAKAIINFKEIGAKFLANPEEAVVKIGRKNLSDEGKMELAQKWKGNEPIFTLDGHVIPPGQTCSITI